MVDILVIGPFSPKDFSTLGDKWDWDAPGDLAGITNSLGVAGNADSLIHKIYLKLAEATAIDTAGRTDGTDIGTIVSAEPITVLGNIYLVVTR